MKVYEVMFQAGYGVRSDIVVGHNKEEVRNYIEDMEEGKEYGGETIDVIEELPDIQYTGLQVAPFVVTSIQYEE
jgi:hypothetical protein